MKTRKKEKQLKWSLIIVGSLGMAFSIFGLINSSAGTDRFTLFMGLVCSICLVGPGLGLFKQNGKCIDKGLNA